jgi:hypothetical protein
LVVLLKPLLWHTIGLRAPLDKTDKMEIAQYSGAAVPLRSTADPQAVELEKEHTNEYLGNPGGIQGRVESRCNPALPHQTVCAVFPHTAFQCSSLQSMRFRPTS